VGGQSLWHIELHARHRAVHLIAHLYDNQTTALLGRASLIYETHKEQVCLTYPRTLRHLLEIVQYLPEMTNHLQ
jgi:hypothetical protein